MGRLSLLVGLGALAALPAGAAAAPSEWQQPVTLSERFGARPPGPTLAVGRTGAVVAAWARPRSAAGRPEVQAARRERPSLPFGSPVTIAVLAGVPGKSPATGVADDGTGTVGWLGDLSVRAARVPVAGPPEPPSIIASRGVFAGLDIGVDRAGTAVAVFAEGDFPSTSALRVVRASDRPADAAGFTAPVTLGATDSTELDLAVAPDGRAVAAWIGLEEAVWAASRDPATGWQPAVRLSGPGPARDPNVAIGEVGGAIVAWFESSPMVAIRDRSGAWSAPEAVAPAAPLPPGRGPAVATSFLGDTYAVAWRQGPAPLALRVAWRGNPARPWRVSAIASPPRNVGEPALVMSQSGDALVAWSQPLSGGSGVRARRVPRGGPLGPVETVFDRLRLARRARSGHRHRGRGHGGMGGPAVLGDLREEDPLRRRGQAFAPGLASAR